MKHQFYRSRFRFLFARFSKEKKLKSHINPMQTADTLMRNIIRSNFKKIMKFKMNKRIVSDARYRKGYVNWEQQQKKNILYTNNDAN